MSGHAPLVVPVESPSPSVRAGRGLVLILGVLTAIAPLAIDMYLPALPEIARNLGIEVGAVQLTLSVFMIGMAVGQAFYGPIADRWGRRGPLLVGMVVFSLAAAGCAGAQSMKSLLAWRLLMALGGSASMVIPRAVVRDLFEEKDSARVYSVLMLILGVSPILAPTLGGQMLGLTGWRGIFWVLAGIGAAVHGRGGVGPAGVAAAGETGDDGRRRARGANLCEADRGPAVSWERCSRPGSPSGRCSRICRRRRSCSSSCTS